MPRTRRVKERGSNCAACGKCALSPRTPGYHKASVGTALGESVGNEGRVATEGALVLDERLQLGQDLLLLLEDLLAPLARRLLVLVELQRIGHQLRLHHVQRLLLLRKGHLLADQRDLRLRGPV